MLSKFLPFIPVAAASSGTATATTPPIVNTILGYVGGIGGGIVAIFLIISIVKDSISLANGQGSGSMWKIIGKVLCLVLMIGLIFLALNYGVLGNTAKDIGQNVLNQGTDIINSAIGGGGTP